MADKVHNARAEAKTAGPDAITLLTAPGKIMTKTTRFWPDGTIRAGAEADTNTWWEWEAAAVRDLDELERLLQRLTTARGTIAVRGAVVRGKTSNSGLIARRSDPLDPYTAIMDVPRAWLMLDIDAAILGGYTVPPDWQDDPEEAVDQIIRDNLPAPFHNAGLVIQWSASMAPAGGEPKVHLWFRLSRPLTTATAKHWLRSYPVDQSVLLPAQPYYTAAPVAQTEAGRKTTDPLKSVRVMMLDGDDVEVPDDLPDVPEVEELGIEFDPEAEPSFNPRFGGDRWIKQLADIGDHEGGKGFHQGIIACAMSFVEETYDPGRQLPDFETFRDAIHERLDECEIKPGREMDREQRKGTRYLQRAVKGWFQKYRRVLIRDETIRDRLSTKLDTPEVPTGAEGRIREWTGTKGQLVEWMLGGKS